MAKHKKIEWEGEEYTLPELARKFGMEPYILRYRLKIGVSLKDALTTSAGSNTKIEWQGRFYSAAELAKKYGMSGDMLRYRLKNNMPLEEALTKKVGRKGGEPTVNLTASNGETHTIEEWSKKLGISHKTLRTRMFREWEPDEILGFIERPPTRGKGE